MPSIRPEIDAWKGIQTPMLTMLRLYAVPATLVGLRISGAVAAFAVSLLMARNMDTAEMGRAMVLMSLAILLGSLACAGLEAGAVRFIAKYRQSGALEKARGFLWLNRRVVWLFGPALCFVAITAIWVHRVWAQSEVSLALIIALLTACATGFLRMGAAHALAFGKVVASLAPSTFIRQMFFLAALTLYIAVIGQPRALQVIALFLVGNLLAIVVQWLWCRGMAHSIAGDGRDISEWREWLTFGLALAPALLFVQYARDLTLIFSAWGLAAEDVAVLGIVTALVAFVKFAVAAINQSITTKMARLIAAEEQAELRELINTSNHMKLWPVVICFGLFALFGERILAVFGEAFQGHGHLLLILMLEPMALAFFGPSGQYISLSGHQRALLPAALVALAVMMGAINLGAMWLGLTGAALGVAVTWIGWSAYLAIYARKKTGMDLTYITSLRDLMRDQKT